MNDDQNQIPELPGPSDSSQEQLRDTLSWFINVALKVGAGYLAKEIIDALGF